MVAFEPGKRTGVQFCLTVGRVLISKSALTLFAAHIGGSQLRLPVSLLFLFMVVNDKMKG